MYLFITELLTSLILIIIKLITWQVSRVITTLALQIPNYYTSIILVFHFFLLFILISLKIITCLHNAYYFVIFTSKYEPNRVIQSSNWTEDSLMVPWWSLIGCQLLPIPLFKLLNLFLFAYLLYLDINFHACMCYF